MSMQFRKRKEALLRFFRESRARYIAPILAAIGLYDLVGSQLLPKALKERLPSVYDFVLGTTGWLSPQQWVVVALIGTTLLALEFAFRRTNFDPYDDDTKKRRRNIIRDLFAMIEESDLALIKRGRKIHTEWQRGVVPPEATLSELKSYRSEWATHCGKISAYRNGINLFADLAEVQRQAYFETYREAWNEFGGIVHTAVGAPPEFSARYLASPPVRDFSSRMSEALTEYANWYDKTLAYLRDEHKKVVG